jgi:single-strand DNA-binding protein
MADCEMVVSGNVSRDPELRFTTGGKAQVSIGVAVNRRWQQNGEWQEQTSFFNVVAWDKLAENVAASCVKGTRVVIHGRLEQRNYETKDGDKKSTVEIIAEDIGISMKWDPASSDKAERSTNATRSATPKKTDEEPF